MVNSKQRIAFKQTIGADLHAATLGTLCIICFEKLENVLTFIHTNCLSHTASGYSKENKQSRISSTVIPLRAAVCLQRLMQSAAV